MGLTSALILRHIVGQRARHHIAQPGVSLPSNAEVTALSVVRS